MRENTTLLLKASRRLRKRDPKKEVVFSLPFRLVGGSGEAGTIVHRDASVSRVFLCKPLASVGKNVEQLVYWSNSILQVVHEHRLDLQLIVVSSACPVKSLVSEAVNKVEGSDSYFSWLHDYMGRWIERVSELGSIAEKHIYLVLTQPAQRGDAGALRPTARQLSALKSKCELLSSALDRVDCSFEILDCSLIRTLVHQQLGKKDESGISIGAPPLAMTKSSIPDVQLAE